MTPVFGIAGRSGSGKTTLIEAMLPLLGARGLRVNAGHGLHYTNVQPIAAIPDIHELNIGHAIVAHALFAGWENAVREMKAIMVAARLGVKYGQGA